MTSASRAERRRRARELARRAGGPDGPLITGVWTDTGLVDIGSMAELPDKVPGKHRWIAAVMYVLSEEHVRNEQRRQAGETSYDTILDHESRVDFSIGCYDCEQPFPVANPDNDCPGDPL